MNQNFKRLKGKSVTDKAMNTDFVKGVIDEQYGNMTQRHDKTDGSYRQVTSVLQDFARKVCGMVLSVNSPSPTFEIGWKEHFTDHTLHILKEQDLKLLIEEYVAIMRMRFPKHVTSSDLIEYSFKKIAVYSGCVARMILHGRHPDLLRSTEGEAVKSMLRRASYMKE